MHHSESLPGAGRKARCCLRLWINQTPLRRLSAPFSLNGGGGNKLCSLLQMKPVIRSNSMVALRAQITAVRENTCKSRRCPHRQVDCKQSQYYGSFPLALFKSMVFQCESSVMLSLTTLHSHSHFVRCLCTNCALALRYLAWTDFLRSVHA